ncbi:MAG: glycosyltransferase [Thiohalocapsa sp.]|uniref:glycosyltransferase family 2 protein n=1 Tax=Thiohalocapsa sp. TaxID=2497641 RepID=UPI0025E53FA4|nr:glycosyltransferase family 2 protein [Thiohalocapsa sp.]MCG6941446.1 glycosyltransferase [Thiohalocapsa sp.]
MSQKPRFAVAIPAYNRAAVIAETLDAVFAQELPPIEVVVVDDGSTDGLSDAIAPFRDKIIFERIENRGAEGARRHAIELTSAPWLALCDSDDCWLPNHLANFARAVRTFPDADFLISNFRTFGDSRSSVSDHFARWPREWYTRYAEVAKPPFLRLGADALAGFMHCNLCFPSASAFRRSFYDAIGGINPALSRAPAADANLTRRALGRGAVTVLDTTVTVLVRKGEDNLSADVVKNLVGKSAMLRREIDLGETPPRFVEAALQVIDETEVDLLWTLFYEQRDDEARRLARSLNGKALDQRTWLLCWLLNQPRPLRMLARRLKTTLWKPGSWLGQP